MWGNQRQCIWTHARLPLFADGGIAVTERRRVERHLVLCPGCRERLESHRSLLKVLGKAAELDPLSKPALPASDRSSLWPAVARQIGESHRPRSTALLGLADKASSPAWAFRIQGIAAVAASLLIVLASGSPGRFLAKKTRSAAAAPDLKKTAVSLVKTGVEEPRTTNVQPVAPVARTTQPKSNVPLRDSLVTAKPAAPSTPPPVVQYDLDRGSPMGTRISNAQQSY